jgi:hypothetical protein
MAKHEKFIINVKNNGKTKDVLAFSYQDAINYAKFIDSENIDIRVYSEDEKLIYSKLRKESKKYNLEGNIQKIHQHHEYHYNLVTGERHVEEHEDSYA